MSEDSASLKSESLSRTELSSLSSLLLSCSSPVVKSAGISAIFLNSGGSGGKVWQTETHLSEIKMPNPLNMNNDKTNGG